MENKTGTIGNSYFEFLEQGSPTSGPHPTTQSVSYTQPGCTSGEWCTHMQGHNPTHASFLGACNPTHMSIGGARGLLHTKVGGAQSATHVSITGIWGLTLVRVAGAGASCEHRGCLRTHDTTWDLHERLGLHSRERHRHSQPHLRKCRGCSGPHSCVMGARLRPHLCKQCGCAWPHLHEQ